MSEFKSALAPYLERMLLEKRALGYKYVTEERMLKSLDRHCVECGHGSRKLEKGIVSGWLGSMANTSPNTRSNAVSVVRELGKMMIRLGEDAYLADRGILPKRTIKPPFIFSDGQLQDFLLQTDKCSYCCEVPFRHIVMPEFFRLLAFSGLRATEARLIRLGDVDFETGAVILRNTKLGRERQIVVHPNMLKRLVIYRDRVLPQGKDEDWLFPGYEGRPMSLSNLEHNFRRFLWGAGISHQGRGGDGERLSPGIHSLRHTYAVNCIRKWAEEGKDIMAYITILQTALGHACLSDTLYYIHLTTNLHPGILKMEEQKLGYIIPSVADS